MKKLVAVGNSHISENFSEKNIDFVSNIQLDAFNLYKKDLKNKFSISTSVNYFHTSKQIFDFCESTPAEYYFVRPHWSLDPKALRNQFSDLRKAHQAAKIILVDPFDQTGSNYFNCHDTVDLILKYQCLKDIPSYLKDYKGGHSYADYYVSGHQCSLEHGTVLTDIPEGGVSKIAPSWSFADQRYVRRNLLKSKVRNLFPQKKKDIDVICRLRAGSDVKNSYYFKNRSLAIDALKGCPSSWATAYGLEVPGETDLIPRKQYLDEFSRSKISVCSFGWGEQTYREFESIFNKSLVIKPDMSHQFSNPNIYEPFVTYVPVKWDYSDLVEKCEHYINNEDERLKIVNNAESTLKQYFKNKSFIEHFSSILEKVNAS